MSLASAQPTVRVATCGSGALGGLGGCPFAPGASGNICTEDLVHMLQAMGYDTGVELDRLLALSRRLSEMVGHEVPSQVVKAGPASRRYPAPATADRGPGAVASGGGTTEHLSRG